MRSRSGCRPCSSLRRCSSSVAQVRRGRLQRVAPLAEQASRGPARPESADCSCSCSTASEIPAILGARRLGLRRRRAPAASRAISAARALSSSLDRHSRSEKPRFLRFARQLVFEGARLAQGHVLLPLQVQRLFEPRPHGVELLAAAQRLGVGAFLLGAFARPRRGRFRSGRD